MERGEKMYYLLNESPIEEMNISTRVYNALMRADKKTVGDVTKLTTEDINSLKNMGKKSIEELNEIIKHIVLVDELPGGKDTEIAIKTFLGKDGNLYEDCKIKDLNLSVRSQNCLENSNLEYISQIIYKTDLDLSAIKNMGIKSVNEILNMINNFELVTANVNNVESSEVENVCRIFIKEITSQFQIPVALVYEKVKNIIEKNIDTEQLSIEIVYEKTRSLLYEIEEITEPFVVFLEKLIEASISGISEIKIYEKLPICMKCKEKFRGILLFMVEQNSIYVNSYNLYEKRYPELLKAISKIENERESNVLFQRVNGLTLEEIGAKYTISRERIRQVEKKALKKLSRVNEDKYKYVFETYDINKDDFILGFNENFRAFNYLTMRYKHGIKDINEMLDDENLTVTEKQSLEKIIYKKYVTLNGERVLCSRAELSEYVLKTVGKEGIIFDEFKDFYYMLLEDLNLQDNPKFMLMDRGYENKMAASRSVLWKQHKTMRYYNIDAYDYSNLYDALNLGRYSNIEFSTLKLFNENEELMKEYDIHDEQELHNLLKKTCPKEIDVKFNRMPNIEFGEADRDQQVMELLLELAPISNVDFAKAYEKEYGVLSQTVLANHMKNFDKYFFGGIYKIDAPRMSEAMSNLMKHNLNNEFYFISEIRQIYKDKFPTAEPNLLNPFTIKELGFRVFTNYAVKDDYLTAVDYFRTLMTKNDLVDVSKFSNGMYNIISFNTEVYRLKASYEIVEYKPQKYINVRKLEAVGYGKELIIDYCSKIKDFTTGNYFTAHSLKKSGFEHCLDELGFDEWFYASLLVEDKNHFSNKRLGNNRLFRKGKEEVRLVDFLEWILYSSEELSMDIYELGDYLAEQYNISINVYKLMEVISGSVLYFDKITEKVYADYEVYFSEI